MKGLIILGLMSISAFAQDRPGPEFREAIKTCAAELGIQPGEGRPPRLSEEDRAKMDACLKEQGVSRPQRPNRGRPPGPAGIDQLKACFEADDIEFPELVPGEKPELSDEQILEMEKCRPARRNRQSQEPGEESNPSAM